MADSFVIVIAAHTSVSAEAIYTLALYFVRRFTPDCVPSSNQRSTSYRPVLYTRIYCWLADWYVTIIIIIIIIVLFVEFCDHFNCGKGNCGLIECQFWPVHIPSISVSTSFLPLDLLATIPLLRQHLSTWFSSMYVFSILWDVWSQVIGSRSRQYLKHCGEHLAMIVFSRIIKKGIE